MRWTVRVLLCLLLGVATTAVVALSCAWSVRNLNLNIPDGVTATRFDTDTGGAPPVLVVEYLEYEGVTIESVTRSAGAVYKTMWYVWADYIFHAAEDQFRGRSVRQCGFPLPAFHALIEWVPSPDRGVEIASSEIVFFDTEASQRFKTGVPLRPMLPGFLINTLLYGILWFGLLFGFGITRLVIRRRRGRCSKCGYDLRGTIGCPECGWNRPKGEGAK